MLPARGLDRLQLTLIPPAGHCNRQESEWIQQFRHLVRTALPAVIAHHPEAVGHALRQAGWPGVLPSPGARPTWRAGTSPPYGFGESFSTRS